MLDLPRWAGRAAAVPLGALAHRRHGKPMHPRGVVLDAVLERCGPIADGVPWPGAGEARPVVVRLSRGAGLPAPLPDLLGLAIRIPDGPVDLLLSSTGRGPLGRRVTVPRRDAAAVYSSIMGYRSAAGTLLVAALPEPGCGPLPSDPGPLADAVARRRPAFTLTVARGTGPWRPFARLRLLGPVDAFDPDVRFDAVRNPPPGLVPDGPMARFRAPAYAAARQGRSRAGQRQEDAHAPGVGS
ncbi:phosphodiesterase [Geodermatophilus sp. CPCC 206100]|uniref:phosphodiesterase n=1 Tax=Geodermatophilus sp. CPCC 206100 TaxID=3020054 RepID=UPI003B0074A8